MNSISADSKKKVMVWSTQFGLGGFYSGVCLLDVIIQEIQLDTNVTTSMISTKLPNLDIYIHTVVNDITRFNEYLIQLIDTLSPRGETTQYILTNTFKGYGDCADQ